VTEGMRYHSITRVLSGLATRQAQAAQRALTGERVGAPADDPIGAAQLLRLRSSVTEMNDYRRAIAAARGDVEFAESTLAEASQLVSRARELAVQGANTTLVSADRRALAQEVATIREELIRLANAKGSRGYVFGGTRIDAAPFDDDGAFSGNDESQVLEIGRGVRVPVSPSGALAFTAAGGEDVFQVLDSLRAALEANDDEAVRGTLDGLEAAHDQVVKERSRVGLVIGRLTVADTTLEHLGADLEKQMSDVGSADPFRAYSEATALTQALERAVTVSQQILSLGSLSRT
ncbi:MAG TPA: flagellar hook-associated protein FlgL, partial [Polyangiaceae bacterium]|nr:flagellar hook-associated protein FlgL [Polyangiaceae bacterium]